MTILSRLGQGEKSAAIARDYGLNESTVRSIKKRKATILSSVASGTTSSTQYVSYTRNPILENMEKALIIWIEDNMQRKIPMTSLIIREQALHIFKRIREQALIINKKYNFAASKGWFQKFKKRYSLLDHTFKDKVELGDIHSDEAELAGIASDEATSTVFTSDEAKLTVIASDEAELTAFASDEKFIPQVSKTIDENGCEPDLVFNPLLFQKYLKKCCCECKQIYENLVKEELADNTFENINIKTEFENISTIDDMEYMSIKQEKIS